MTRNTFFREQGLLKGDKIMRFGSIHLGNHQKLHALNIFVVDNEGVCMSVRIFFVRYIANV